MDYLIGILYVGLVAITFILIKLINVCMLLDDKIEEVKRRIK